MVRHCLDLIFFGIISARNRLSFVPSLSVFDAPRYASSLHYRLAEYAIDFYGNRIVLTLDDLSRSHFVLPSIVSLLSRVVLIPSRPAKPSSDPTRGFPLPPNRRPGRSPTRIVGSSIHAAYATAFQPSCLTFLLPQRGSGKNGDHPGSGRDGGLSRAREPRPRCPDRTQQFAS